MLLNSQKCPNCSAYYDPTLKECPHCHKNNELYDRKVIPERVMFFHPVAQIGIFLAGFSFVGMVICEFISTFFVIFMEKGILQTTILLLLTYLMMIGAIFIISFTTRWKLFTKKFTDYRDYLMGLAYAGIIILASLLLSIVINLFYQGGENANQEAAVNISTNYPIFSFFILCLLGPICEEMTYRVGLYSFFRRINKYLAFAVTIIVFTFIHFDFTAADLTSELWSLPSYIVCGLILTIAYEHRGPACSMMAHIAYNLFAFIMIFVGAING